MAYNGKGVAASAGICCTSAPPFHKLKIELFQFKRYSVDSIEATHC